MNKICNLFLLLYLGIGFGKSSIPQNTFFENSHMNFDEASISFQKVPILQDSSKINVEQQFLLELSIQEGDYKLTGELYKEMSECISPLENIKDFIKYSDNSYSYFLKAKDTLSALKVKLEKGMRLRKNRAYLYAMESFIDALEVSKQIDNKELTINLLNEIGIIYVSVRDFDQAKKLFSQAMETTESIKNSQLHYRNYNNYGNVLLRQKKLDSAIFYLKQALLISKTQHLNYAYKMCLLDLADAYIKKGDYTTGLQYAKMNEEQFYKSQKEPTAETDLLISDAYFGMGDSLKGYHYLIKGYNNVRLRKGLYYKLGVEQRMVDYYERKGNYRLALSHKHKYQELSKAYSDNDMSLGIQKMKLQDIFFQKDRIIDTLVQEQQKKVSYFKRNQKLIILGSAMFITIILGVFIVYKYRSERVLAESKRKEAESKLEALHSKMNPHFLFNTLNGIQNHILKSNKIDAYNVLNDFSQLLRIMLRNSYKTNIRLSEEINFLKLYLSFQKMRSTNEFVYNIEVDEKLLHIDPLIPNMMLQPHIENALIHAFPENFEAPRKLNLIFQQMDNGVFCTITDNGVGRKATLDDSTPPKRITLSFFSENLKKRIDYLQQLGYENAMIKIKDLYNEMSPVGTSVEMYLPYISTKS